MFNRKKKKSGLMKSNIIQNVVRGLITIAAVSWSWRKLKSAFVDFVDGLVERWEEIRANLRTDRIAESIGDTSKKMGELKAKMMGKEYRTEEVMKKKKKFSFFKVLLVLGVLMAVAIYIIDRILPKPYSDEDLDDAWQTGDEQDFGASDTNFENTPPPAADMTYDVSSEDEPQKEAEGDSSEEDKDKDEDEEEEEKK